MGDRIIWSNDEHRQILEYLIDLAIVGITLARKHGVLEVLALKNSALGESFIERVMVSADIDHSCGVLKDELKQILQHGDRGVHFAHHSGNIVVNGVPDKYKDSFAA